MRLSTFSFLKPRSPLGPVFSTFSAHPFLDAPTESLPSPFKLSHSAFKEYPNLTIVGFENTQQLLGLLDKLGEGETVRQFCSRFDPKVETTIELWQMKDPSNPYYFMILNNTYYIVLNHPQDIAASARLERPLIPMENLSAAEYEQKIRRLLPGVKIDEQLQAAQRQPNPVVHKLTEIQTNEGGWLLNLLGNPRIHMKSTR